MTKDELDAIIKESVDRAVKELGPKYEEAKTKSKEKYNELVALWGRRAVNTVLILGALAVAYFAGKFI